MTAIILLNWNGASDTIACLDSLSRAEGDFFVVVADNGSTDDSLVRIQQWQKDRDAAIQASSNVVPDLQTFKNPFECYLLPLGENYGFAKGNNMAIHFAHSKNPDSYLLLNNDTEVQPDFLANLLSFSAVHPECRALMPKINYFGEKNRVWHCGGKLHLGRHSYYYANALDADVPSVDYLPIQFISGCALFVYPDLLQTNGNLLTERFFFGEEDFEFSLRMKKQSIPMACVLSSLIYHKVGSSRGVLTSGKVYVAYLSRFIDIRLHYHQPFVFFWRLAYYPKCFLTFLRSKAGVWKSLRLTNRLYRESRHQDCVSAEDYRLLIVECA